MGVLVKSIDAGWMDWRNAEFGRALARYFQWVDTSSAARSEAASLFVRGQSLQISTQLLSRTLPEAH